MLSCRLRKYSPEAYVEDLVPNAAMIRTRILRMGSAQERFDLTVGLTIDGLN